MSKTSTKGRDYGKVTPALVKRVREVIAEGDRHRYSVSAVYRAYNEAFGKNDIPQTCSSCLRNRVRELRRWLEGYNAHETEKRKQTAEIQGTTTETPNETEMQQQKPAKGKRKPAQENNEVTGEELL